MFYHKMSSAPLVVNAHPLTRGDGENYHPARSRSHISIVVRGTETYYCDNGEVVEAAPGDIVYTEWNTPYRLVHRGSFCYRLQLWVAREGEGNRIEVVHPKNPEFYESLFRKICDEWKAAEVGYRYRTVKLLAEIYERLLLDEAAQAQGKKYALIEEGVNYILQNFKDPDATVKEAAKCCAVSEVYFRKLYREIFGKSPKDALTDIRMEAAKELLCRPDARVCEVAAACGFSSVKHFSRAFREYTGFSPRAFAAYPHGEGEEAP